jgi:hypothetical protein
MDLMNYLNTATTSLFRFESLQDYDVEGEKEEVKIFKQTRQLDDSDMKEWWSFIDGKVATGVQMQRVRLVMMPMTDYTEMELEIHKKSALHGDDIRTITEEKFKTLNVVPKFDFWLIDDTIVLIMNYDLTGKYLGFSVQGGVHPYSEYVGIKKALLENSKKIV